MFFGLREASCIPPDRNPNVRYDAVSLQIRLGFVSPSSAWITGHKLWLPPRRSFGLQVARLNGSTLRLATTGSREFNFIIRDSYSHLTIGQSACDAISCDLKPLSHNYRLFVSRAPPNWSILMGRVFCLSQRISRKVNGSIRNVQKAAPSGTKVWLL